MQTLQEVTREVKPAIVFYVGDGQAQRNEAAWHTGYETGLAGQFPQGSEIYEICSGEWYAYADGYEAGKNTFMIVTSSNVYSGPADNEYPIFTSRTSRNEFLALIGGN